MAEKLENVKYLCSIKQNINTSQKQKQIIKNLKRNLLKPKYYQHNYAFIFNQVI